MDKAECPLCVRRFTCSGDTFVHLKYFLLNSWLCTGHGGDMPKKRSFSQVDNLLDMINWANKLLQYEEALSTMSYHNGSTKYGGE